MSETLTISELLPMPQLKSGVGALQKLKEIVANLGIQSPLVITGPELTACGVLRSVTEILDEIPHLRWVLFDQVTPDPDIDLVERITALGRSENVDGVLALGGGSPIDASKIASQLIPSRQTVRGLMAQGVTSRGLPLIAIPTTAGTGSEVTPVAILTDLEDNLKKGVVSDRLIPQVAVLDPRLTVDLPRSQTAYTGLDALTHAVEAYGSKKATPLTDFYAETAITLIRRYLRRAYHQGHDLEARGQMQLAAYFAGIAFANASVTAAHALAYPLGARYHLPHGLAVILLLPAVLEYNQPIAQERFDALGQLLTGDRTARADRVIPAIIDLCHDLDIKLGLESHGVHQDSLLSMAESALSIRRILDHNPRPITQVQDSAAIYERAFHDH